MVIHPVVSVIMTVYNGERYLARAIESIRKQSFRNFEFIIVDDGSVDRTHDILKKAQADPRIKVSSQPHLGRARVLNIAWKQACGDYIAILDADDFSEPDRLIKQLRYLKEHPEIGLLGTNFKYISENGVDERIIRLPSSNSKLRKSLVRNDPFAHSSVMMPRHVLKEVGGYNENFKVGLDYELWVRIASRYHLACLPDVLTVRRLHGYNYFLHVVSSWQRCKVKVKIRWYAWRRFSHNILDLYFVFIEPVMKLLNAQTGGRLSKIKTFKFFGMRCF